MPEDSSPGQPVQRSRDSRGCASLGGILLLIFGFCWILGLCVIPLASVALARDWVPTSCQVTSSQAVCTHAGKSPTFRADIRYNYTFRGRKYRGLNYDFLGDHLTKGRAYQAVALYPEGSSRTCYVNPGHPAEAVLDRSFSTDYLAAAEVGLLAIGVGVAVLLGSRKAQQQDGGTPAGQGETAAQPLQPSQE